MDLAKPTAVFDGDCHFCCTWIARWKSVCGDRADFVPYQTAAPAFPDIPLERFQKAVHLIFPDGRVFSGAHSVFQLLALNPGYRWTLLLYERVPLAAPVCEAAYRLVAGHRPFFSRVTRLLWGNSVEPECGLLSSWIFLRLLGLIYLAAFVSLGVQVSGLIGSQGILPASDFLKQMGGSGGIRFWPIPTVFWWGATDGALRLGCALGAAVSAAVVLDVLPAFFLAAAWILYLSFVNVGGDFLEFQWDALLLEAGFLAIFLAPLKIKPGFSREPAPSRTVLWLFRWLLFRLMFMSGLVKLTSGDAAWRSLTALTYHYQTQPLPTWASWFAHRLPLAFQKFSAAGMFAIELSVPFFIFAPKRLRHAACWILISFEFLILVTGNYGFFNFLTIALCFLSMSDSIWPAFLRRWAGAAPLGPPPARARRWPRVVIAGVAVVAVVVTASETIMRMGWRAQPPSVVALDRAFSPFHVFNTYGLFAVMTTSRPEIIVEGSMDGAQWRPYEFNYKPGEVRRRPSFVAPHQPRLDWQMWFAALGDYRSNVWFLNFCGRLLQGSPPVLRLLKTNPFPDRPPRYIRATVYDYRFSTPAEKRADGAWWRRERKDLYCPLLSLKTPGTP